MYKSIFYLVVLILAGLVVVSLIMPPGKWRAIVYFLTVVFIFLFIWCRSAAKKVPDKEDAPWDI